MPNDSLNRARVGLPFVVSPAASASNPRPANSAAERLTLGVKTNMKEAYRSGAIGALMDEYERAASELGRLIERIPEDDFVRVVDSETSSDDCRSVQTIMSHVVRAGYGYADYIREQFSIASARPAPRLLSREESLEQLDAALRYTARTLEGRWEMSEEEISRTVIDSRWGVVYDVEGLLEHAIVHILRHRRQIEKFIWRGVIAVNPGAADSPHPAAG
jgi:uncharacterized damage-inducible protein DinB